ncbi:MAG TPA: DUF5995 family protein [Archangium sp.]|jgi:hypothetical protein|uniref:DUF5995 family protein n=1 Tax=Archangium sp. TaxID=1872627 RepID=UPI002EDA1363
MREKLSALYAAGDNRAIFLRAYHVMTTQVNAAVHGGNDDFATPIFFDPGWVDRLAGRFARLYFQSLQEPVCDAWTKAHEQASQRRSSVVQNMLLGINAHINFDLALGIHEVLQEEGDASDPELMARRKFDHDQMNNVLMRCNPKIQEVLAREFGGGARLFSGLFGMLDELLTVAGLRYYRDRVWCNTLGLLSARTPKEHEKVRLRLNWESLQTAEFLIKGTWMNDAVFFLDKALRRPRWGRFEPDADRGARAGGRVAHQLKLLY